MLKMYHKQAHSGSSPDFWEENWEASEFAESIRFCTVDPLRPLFEKYLRPDSLMLEGGCGMGNYVSYYTARGFNVIGVDFALNTLKTLHIRQPQAKLCGGDVSQLPFADKTFDLYYSGGVVEHFESGAEDSLREAQRVLKQDGVLLISVPYYSPLRKILSPFRKADWRIVDRSEVEQRFGGKNFFQYAYTRREFSGMLREVGLDVVDTQGYAVLWGLYELPLLNRNGKSEFTSERPRPKKADLGEIDLKQVMTEKNGSLLKRLAVNEDSTVPVLGTGVRIMRWASANMMMYVCRPAK